MREDVLNEKKRVQSEQSEFLRKQAQENKTSSEHIIELEEIPSSKNKCPSTTTATIDKNNPYVKSGFFQQKTGDQEITLKKEGEDGQSSLTSVQQSSQNQGSSNEDKKQIDNKGSVENEKLHNQHEIQSANSSHHEDLILKNEEISEDQEEQKVNIEDFEEKNKDAQNNIRQNQNMLSEGIVQESLKFVKPNPPSDIQKDVFLTTEQVDDDDVDVESMEYSLNEGSINNPKDYSEKNSELK